ncbi:MAG: hypothetical protein ACE5RN_08850, partial [Nitrosopumilaceae archaeon]
MQKSRIIALALIGIMLSSSSVSVADGYTIWLDTNENNLSPSFADIETHQIYKIKLVDATSLSFSKKTNPDEFYNINLKDGVTGSYDKRIYDKGRPYTINLNDGVGSTLKDPSENFLNNKKQKIISITIFDGISSGSIDEDNEDSKIILIKQADERKALWERIFPLDRIRNGVKSLYKIIQNDHSLSYIQFDEISSQNSANSLKQTPIDESVLEQMSEFEKFVAKSLYTAEQIEIYSNNILDLNKFIGKAGYVSDQLAIHAQHYTDPDKFVGKAGYVVDQLAIHAQHYSDPEKFVGKSKFVGEQLSIAVYQIVDPNQPALLVLLLPLAGLVIIRYENERIRFHNFQKFVSYVFILILVSSSIVGPISYSFVLWGNAFAQEDPLGETVGPPNDPPLVNQIEKTIEN